MGLFTGVGDFFRGAFGEDEEEKRRRKEQERQAAQAKAAEQAAQARTIQQQSQAPKYKSGISGFFEKAGDKLEANSPQDIYKRKDREEPTKRYDGGAFGQKARDFTVAAGRELARVPETVYRSIDKGMDETAANDIEKAIAEKDPNKRKELVKKISDPRGAWFQLGKTKMLDENMTEEQLIALKDAMRIAQGQAPQYNEGAKRFFYGSEPVQSYQQRYRGLKSEFKGNESAAQKYLEGQGEGGKELAATITRNGGSIALFLAVLGVAGDVFPDATDLVKAPAKKIGKEALEEVAVASSDEAASALVKAGANQVDNAVDVAEEAVQRGSGDVLQELTDEELRSLAGDIETPAYQRTEYKNELARRENIQEKANNPNKAAYDEQRSRERGEGNILQEVQDVGGNPGDINDIPAYSRRDPDGDIRRAREEMDKIDEQLSIAPERTIEEYKFTQKQKLADDIKANPTKKDQLIELYNRRIAAADNLKNLDEYRAKLELRKSELQQVVDNANLVKQKLDEAAEAQAKQTDEAFKAQQATNAAVEADQAAGVNPDLTGTKAPETGNPEVDVNNAYGGQSAEEILFPDSPEYKGRDGLNLLQKISPDRLIRENITRPIENLVDRVIAAAQRSKIAPARGVGRFFTGINTEMGVDPLLQAARQQLRGGVEYGKLLRERIADLNKNMSKEQVDRVWANLDPEQAARLGIEGGKMSADELVLFDKLKTLIDNTTAENLRRGLITPEAAQDGYIKRAYSVYDGNTDGITQFEQGFRQELLGQYKGRKQVSDDMVQTAITDPSYLVGKKTAESNAMWAMQDYGNYLNSKGLAVDSKRAGYTQLPDSPVFGDAAGKWVPRNVAEDFTGFQYNNAMVSAISDVFNIYDRWGVRQAKKQLLTIFNPAVRLGNQVSNRAIFSQLNGTNPIQFNKVFGEVDDMMKNGDPLYREAVQGGLTGIDITQADFYAKRIANATGDQNLAKQAIEHLQKSYSKADDKARIAAYVIHRRRGYSAEEAARLVQRGFQDYKSVGFFYDMAAKTPIIGNAFVRFVADSIRIAKNAAVDHPLRTAGTVALWAAFANGMSIISGEGRGDVDEQGNDASSSLRGDNVAEQAFNLVTGKTKGADQKARETRFGSPVIPFTNISLTTQTPWGEVNAARFMPWYALNDISEGAQRYLPISQSPIKIEDGKPVVNGAGFADPLLGQLFQLGFDKDFRNRSIQDPDNTGQLDRDPLSAEQKWKNVARFLGVNNLPMGREGDAVISAATGNPDIYGKVRSLPQALLRSGGIKVETYGDEQIADQRGTESYYKELEQIEKDLEGMSPEAQEAWKRLTGYNKLREKVPNEFKEGEERWKKYPVYDFPEDKWKDYSTHPELYELMMNKKINDARERGEKVQPAFDPRLSEGFRRQLIENKIVAPGDDAELDQRMYASPEWDYYQTLDKAYKAQFEDDEFTDELVKHKTADFPEKPDILKQYGAQYGAYTKGQAPKPEFTDELKAAKEAYNMETFNWTNKEREARGLDAIVWDVWNNPTFGFDETPSGMGFGFGGGGGSTRPYQTNMMGNLSNYTDSVKRLDAITPQEMANLSQFFGKLQAGGGGGRTKPKIGASSTGL